MYINYLHLNKKPLLQTIIHYHRQGGQSLLVYVGVQDDHVIHVKDKAVAYRFCSAGIVEAIGQLPEYIIVRNRVWRFLLSFRDQPIFQCPEKIARSSDHKIAGCS